jgi:predicted RNA-binding protein
MCEANAYLIKGSQEELVLESVDIIKPEDEGGYRLVSIFGEQKIIEGKIKFMNLVNHKIVFEE